MNYYLWKILHKFKYIKVLTLKIIYLTMLGHNNLFFRDVIVTITM